MSKEHTRTSFTVVLGISVFWLPISFVTEGLTNLVLPHLLESSSERGEAGALGLLTFTGLLLAMIVQPYAGNLSDRTGTGLLRYRTVAVGVGMTLVSLAVFYRGGTLATGLGYILVLAGCSVSQAGLQGLLPDVVPLERRGFASGLKGFMDLAGSTVAFFVLGATLSSGGRGLSLGVMAALLVGFFLLSRLMVRSAVAGRSDGRKGGGGLAVFRVDLAAHPKFGRLVFSRFLFLTGVFTVGRFFLLFVGDRLGLDPDEAAEQAGALLGTLSLISLLAGPAGGWLADRRGRVPTMRLGALCNAAGVLLLNGAATTSAILVSGSLMAVGSAFFSAANWAATADAVPPGERARYLGVANFGTGGAAAVAGLFGPVIDLGNAASGSGGYTLMFLGAAGLSTASAFACRKAHINSRAKY